MIKPFLLALLVLAAVADAAHAALPARTLTVTDSSAAGTYEFVHTWLGPRTYDVTGPAHWAAEGCDVIAPLPAGTIVVIERTTKCGTLKSTRNAQAAGAAGILFVAPQATRISITTTAEDV